MHFVQFMYSCSSFTLVKSGKLSLQINVVSLCHVYDFIYRVKRVIVSSRPGLISITVNFLLTDSLLDSKNPASHEQNCYSSLYHMRAWEIE